MQFYARSGEEVTMEQWLELMRSDGYRRVALTSFGDVQVSTVWLGMHIPLRHKTPPLIFETMIFAEGSDLDEAQWRHTTLDDAITMHDMVALTVSHDLSEKAST